MGELTVSEYYPENFMGNADCPLDDFFGAVVTAERLFREEIETQPFSLTELSAESAQLLHQYMATAVNGLAISQVSHNMLPILWVLDQGGRVFLALEEVYDEASKEKKYPLARGMRVPEGFYKLGHPSLINGEEKVARIGGELLFDPDPEFGISGWVITNASGRFGFGPNRTQKHLRNVADVFGSYGLPVDTFYYPPAS